MRVNCLHGYFIFEETKVGELSRFLSIFEFDLVKKNTYYIFSSLEDAPNYSLAGGTFLGCPTTKTFEGNPWDVMRENALVYDFINDVVVPIASITTRPSVFRSANYYFSSGLILPGSVTDDGLRVTDYASGYLFDSVKFKYTEVIYG